MARRRCISPAGTTSSAPGSPAIGPPHRKRPVSPTSIPVLQSPKKKRRAKAEKSDLDIWDENDNDIIGISLHNLNVCVSRTEILAAGGVLQYWENARATRPRLAQMALDFLSAPASSVDAERAFSGGRLQVNHLQHGISSQTFKAQVAVGSWFNTPLMPDLSVATNIMRQKMAKGKEKEAGRLVSAKSTVIDIM